ncbi:MAG TPA: metalloregulator ArsR/SmtB family transcription factor [Candidatus Saccharimonadales bacterium]|jgi:DNA-binding transcriptional ArsR family regulator
MNVEVLEALAEPNRFNIIELLRGGPLPVGYIAQRLDMDQPQTSKHLRVLKDAHIVAAKPDAQRRLYYLRPQAFSDIEGWAESYRQCWEQRFDNLDEYLKNNP